MTNTVAVEDRLAGFIGARSHDGPAAAAGCRSLDSPESRPVRLSLWNELGSVGAVRAEYRVTPEHVSRLRWWRPSSSPRAGPRREPRGSRCRSRLPCPGDPYVANALVRFPASSSGAAHHTRHGTEMIYRLVGHTPARARSRTICCWAQALPELRTRSARRSAGTSHTTTYTRATLVPSASSPAARIDRNRLPAGRVAREWFGDRRPSLSCRP